MTGFDPYGLPGQPGNYRPQSGLATALTQILQGLPSALSQGLQLRQQFEQQDLAPLVRMAQMAKLTGQPVQPTPQVMQLAQKYGMQWPQQRVQTQPERITQQQVPEFAGEEGASVPKVEPAQYEQRPAPVVSPEWQESAYKQQLLALQTEKILLQHNAALEKINQMDRFLEYKKDDLARLTAQGEATNKLRQDMNNIVAARNEAAAQVKAQEIELKQLKTTLDQMRAESAMQARETELKIKQGQLDVAKQRAQTYEKDVASRPQKPTQPEKNLEEAKKQYADKFEKILSKYTGFAGRGPQASAQKAADINALRAEFLRLHPELAEYIQNYRPPLQITLPAPKR